MSINGMYVITEDNVYSVAEGKSYNIHEINPKKWIDILSENNVYSLKNNMHTISGLASYHRRVTYQLMEGLSDALRTNLMLEYEGKFGNLLLTENYVLIEGWFSDAWSWTKDKVGGALTWVTDKLKQFGAFAVQTGKDFIACVTGKGCSPFFEDYRTMLLHPIGIAVETFLTATVAGGIGPIVAWGILAIYDGYLLISGDPKFEWFNLICDLLGMLLAPLAKVFKTAVAALKGGSKTLIGAIELGMKNPATKGILTKLGSALKGGGQTVMNTLKSAGKIMTEKFGLKWVGRVLDNIGSQIGNLIEALGFKANSKILAKTGIEDLAAANKSVIQAGSKRAVKAGTFVGATTSAIDYGVNKVAGNIEAKAAAKNSESLKPMYSKDLDNLYKELKVK